MTISTEYLKELLANISQYPWKYESTTTKRYAGETVEEKYSHQISNDYGTLMGRTCDEVYTDNDANFELAALAPTLAKEVLELRGRLERLEAQDNQPVDEKPAHPEYLETLEDYENAPVGIILDDQYKGTGVYLVKRNPTGVERWHVPGYIWSAFSKYLAGTRRRVIYWPEEGAE